ncbi:MAG: CapA family protein [Deltaproteobacteria bacterium]|jgi:hypothetical protein|nr:CapA family protein [Deltaproteobacteria bacterium]
MDPGGCFAYGTNLPGTGGNPLGIEVNVITEERVRASLAAARESGPDVTVALFHWGTEYAHGPTQTQIRLAEISAEEGADLVIGTHPHVLQPIEVLTTPRGRTVAAYSLGNFMANQMKAPRERSAVLAVELRKIPGGGAGIIRVSVAPVYVSSACTDASGCVSQLLYGGGAPADADGTAARSHFGDPDGSGHSGDPEARTDPRSPQSPSPPDRAPGHAGTGDRYGEGRQAGSGRAMGYVGAASSARAGAPAAPVITLDSAPPGPEWSDLPEASDEEAAKASEAGARVLDFLGAYGEPDAYGFYTVWDASRPGKLPLPRRTAP